MDSMFGSPTEKSHVEALAPNIMLFGDRGLCEVIRVRLGHEVGVFVVGLVPL